jgi:hypothetical protein
MPFRRQRVQHAAGPAHASQSDELLGNDTSILNLPFGFSPNGSSGSKLDIYAKGAEPQELLISPLGLHVAAEAGVKIYGL